MQVSSSDCPLYICPVKKKRNKCFSATKYYAKLQKIECNPNITHQRPKLYLWSNRMVKKWQRWWWWLVILWIYLTIAWSKKEEKKHIHNKTDTRWQHYSNIMLSVERSRWFDLYIKKMKNGEEKVPNRNWYRNSIRWYFNF